MKNELQGKRWTFFTVEFGLLEDERLSVTQKLTYIALTSFASRERVCFPSQEAVAKRVGCTRETVNRAIQALIEKGYILKEFRDNGSCPYTLLGVTLPHNPVRNSHNPCEKMSHEVYPLKDIQLSTEAYMSKTQNVLDESSARIPWDEVKLAWNETLGNLGKPNIRDWTDSRKKKFAKLWKKDGMSEVSAWRDFFGYIATLKFLMKVWPRWNFDWVIKEANYTKIVEGNYERG